MAPGPRIGTEFAGYRIEALLGRGGMGVVYRAEHPRLRASVALKVMAPELAMDEGFRERFVKEARVAAGIGHPNIVPIYDAGEWRGDLYIAMRYIEGDDLGARLRGGRPLPPGETFSIARQIASALDAAHRSGLVHRDVKPANILLESGHDGDSSPSAYLADLGLTKELGARSGITGSGELVGTIDYMAPEQISDLPVDGRADVYSFACVLFQCLTGSPPYVRENRAALLWAHLHDEVPLATDINPQLPERVSPVLARGMAKRPEDRFDTARDLVGALQAPVDGTATASQLKTEAHGPREAAGSPSRKTSARRPRTMRALTFAALIGTLLGGVAVAVAFLLLSGDEGSGPPKAAAQVVTTTRGEEPADSRFTAFDKALVRYVPEAIRPTCRHSALLSTGFDSTVSCHPGGAVESLTYSHARSSRYLHEFMNERRAKAGLPTYEEDARALIGLCSAGQLPSINNTAPFGWRGRVELAEPVEPHEGLGRIICARSGGLVRIEWLTQEAAIFAMAKGTNLAGLYEWWSTEAGPDP
jgi:Protein kinase domain